MIPSMILFEGPADAAYTVCLAHGAGAPMDSPFMQAFASGLALRGFRAARFEFPYMAERRMSGIKKPPNQTSVLLKTWQAIIADLKPTDQLIIGGKSMGGRMASLVADKAGVAGLVCLGYPFHSPGKAPGPLRLEHLAIQKTPTLICQGNRDPFGLPSEVSEYKLSSSISICWLKDGDHSFKPRKTSGRTEEQNWNEALDSLTTFIERL